MLLGKKQHSRQYSLVHIQLNESRAPDDVTGESEDQCGERHWYDMNTQPNALLETTSRASFFFMTYFVSNNAVKSRSEQSPYARVKT